MSARSLEGTLRGVRPLVKNAADEPNYAPFCYLAEPERTKTVAPSVSLFG